MLQAWRCCQNGFVTPTWTATSRARTEKGGPQGGSHVSASLYIRTIPDISMWFPIRGFLGGGKPVIDSLLAMHCFAHAHALWNRCIYINWFVYLWRLSLYLQLHLHTCFCMCMHVPCACCLRKFEPPHAWNMKSWMKQLETCKCTVLFEESTVYMHLYVELSSF